MREKGGKIRIMENKNNFMGIVITVVVAVILLTVLPIVNSINAECPPCEEIPSYNIGNLEVNPNFSSGDYIVDKGSYDYIDSVTIIKDENLIPENIKKDVNIFGVVGTYEVVETVVGPKLFEVGDVLPVTTRLIITDLYGNIQARGGVGHIKTDGDNFLFINYNVDFDTNEIFDINSVSYRSSWSGAPYAIIDTSSWSLEKRTVSSVTGIFDDDLFWLDFWGND